MQTAAQRIRYCLFCRTLPKYSLIIGLLLLLCSERHAIEIILKLQEKKLVEVTTSLRCPAVLRCFDVERHLILPLRLRLRLGVVLFAANLYEKRQRISDAASAEKRN